MNHFMGTVQRVQRVHDSLHGPILQASVAQRLSGIKSKIKPSIKNMTVALFAQMQSLDMLSPFAAAVAVRCPLRFCTQCKSLSCQTDGFEKTLMSGHRDMAHSLMPHCEPWNIYIGTHYWYTQGRKCLSDCLMI
jgi:hypothetical protein